jgi:hypothetical protein
VLPMVFIALALWISITPSTLAVKQTLAM